MKKAGYIFILLILIMALGGCSNVMTEGEVYDKEFREEYTTIMTLPLVITNGKTTSTILVPYVIHYPDRYVIHIKAFIGNEWVTEDFYVSESVYDSVNIGDMFVFDGDRGDLSDEPYTKEKQ
jgi:hypothetical protein